MNKIKANKLVFDENMPKKIKYKLTELLAKLAQRRSTGAIAEFGNGERQQRAQTLQLGRRGAGVIEHYAA